MANINSAYVQHWPYFKYFIFCCVLYKYLVSYSKMFAVALLQGPPVGEKSPQKFWDSASDANKTGLLL